MAPAANNSTKVFVTLAILLVAGTATAVHGSRGKEEGCIRRVDGNYLPAGCVCYDRCASPDGEGLGGVDSQTCFVDCVLRHGCVCPAPLPATLDKTLTMTVTRPKVSTSREDKRRAEEALLIKFDVEGHGSTFEVRVNGDYLEEFFALPPGEGITKRIPLSGFLEDRIRADGDKTIEVSLVPRIHGEMITVRDVRIVYQDKELLSG